MDDDPPESVTSHTLGFYVHPGHQLLDLAGPLDAFQATGEVAGRQLYEACVLSRTGGPTPGAAGLSIGTEPAHGARVDILELAQPAFDRPDSDPLLKSRASLTERMRRS